MIRKIKNAIDSVEICFLFSVLMIIAIGIYIMDYFEPTTKHRKSKFPDCTCNDSTQCEMWCIGKENFTNYNE